MKISGTRPIDSAPVRRVARREESAGAPFRLDDAASAAKVAGVSQPAPVAAVDALLTLQGVSEAGEGRKRAVKRADRMLDLLDDIRIGLLEGLIPRGKLESLLHVVQLRRDDVGDPRLSGVLDEVELRARVELAKYGSAAP
jgi:hypothetical protein